MIDWSHSILLFGARHQMKMAVASLSSRIWKSPIILYTLLSYLSVKTNKEFLLKGVVAKHEATRSAAKYLKQGNLAFNIWGFVKNGEIKCSDRETVRSVCSCAVFVFFFCKYRFVKQSFVKSGILHWSYLEFNTFM